MAGLLAGGDATAQLALAGGGSFIGGKLEEPDHSSTNWYFSRDQIEKESPSRLDGIDLKKETYFRKSYCTFLQDLGMNLKVPQVTIATAIVFCHRFFLRQTHLKNDRHMIATICMFLAGKVEETPRALRDVILMSYEIRHKKDPVAVQRIKQKDVYEEQKELVLAGERLVLTTLGFDLNIHHPYKPLVAAIKKFKVAQSALAQVAWNFVNDGLRTSLCLQFKPHHIAAGAIFLAAKFLKVKLPSDGEKVWWQEFEVTPRQLEEVSNQMLELYEQNKTGGANTSRSSDPGPSMAQSNRLKGVDTHPSLNGNHWQLASSQITNSEKNEKHVQTAKVEESVPSTSRREDDYEFSASHIPSAAYEGNENGQGADYEPAYENGSISGVHDVPLESSRSSKPLANGIIKQTVKEAKEEFSIGTPEEGQIKEEMRERKQTEHRVKTELAAFVRKTRVKAEAEDRKGIMGGGSGAREVTEARSSLEDREADDVVESKVVGVVKMEPAKSKPEIEDEEPRKSWVTSITDVDTDKVKAAMKRRKSRGEGLDSRPAIMKLETTDEEELLERELESGVEAAAEAERVKQERRDSKSRFAQKSEQESTELKKDRVEDGDGALKRRRFNEDEFNEKKRTKSADRGDGDGDGDRCKTGFDRTEDGELPSSSHAQEQSRSPRPSERRPLPSSGPVDKAGSPSKRHRDQHVRRDGYRDNRSVYTQRDRDYHQTHHHHQHRPEGDRDRHHNREREWADRDHKKTRHDHGS